MATNPLPLVEFVRSSAAHPAYRLGRHPDKGLVIFLECELEDPVFLDGTTRVNGHRTGAYIVQSGDVTETTFEHDVADWHKAGADAIEELGR